MPTNLYGPNDNYHPQNSHVLPALISRFHEAARERRPEVVAWGTGSPMREFLHVDDLADACAFILGLDNPPDWLNVGTGTDVTIRELPGLNHLFQTCKTGSPAEYAGIEETFAPAALDVLTHWIRVRADLEKPTDADKKPAAK
jgi:dTDP-D-glucose 4,6-dehydratase